MEKRQIITVLCLALIVFSLGTISSQQKNESKLDASAGITPDSPFYFLEGILNNFKSDFKVKEEKVAEIRKLIREGKIEEAKKSLEEYKKIANKLEKNVPPSKKEEAQESARQIRQTVKELEDEIPEEEREKFVDEVVEKEEKISQSAKIAEKVKELCEKLAKKDPKRYAEVCKTDEESPEWQRELDEDLTEKQKEEAERFEEVMSQCFETSGEKCRCDEIPFDDFANTCSKAAPLAKKCEKEGNKEACRELSQLEMPELPPHLEKTFEEVQSKVRESKFDAHMPEECKEAGAESPQECQLVMMKKNAPEPCRQELQEKDVESIEKAEKICEKTMFKQNAPDACVEANITDPEECRKYTFKQNAPEKCVEENITDPRECRELMESSRPSEGAPSSGRPPVPINCKEIEDPEKRLECYDNAIERENKNERPEKLKEEKPSGERFPKECREEGITDPRECQKLMQKKFEDRPEKIPERPERPKGSGFPEECKEKGIEDPRECQEFLNERERDREASEESKTEENESEPEEEPIKNESG